MKWLSAWSMIFDQNIPTSFVYQNVIYQSYIALKVARTGELKRLRMKAINHSPTRQTFELDKFISTVEKSTKNLVKL